LCEGGGGKPAKAEAAGDAAAKKRACKLFLPPCVPTASACGLGTVDRPRAQRGGTPKRKIKLFYYIIYGIEILLFLLSKHLKINCYEEKRKQN